MKRIPRENYPCPKRRKITNYVLKRSLLHDLTVYASKEEICKVIEHDGNQGLTVRGSRKGQKQSPHYLLERKIDEHSSYEPLEEVYDMIISLLCKGNAEIKTALHAAAVQDNLLVARKLIAHGVNVNYKNSQGRVPLHSAAKHGKSEDLLELLLDHGADINARDSSGRTPLHFAVSSRITQKALLRYGAHVNVRDKQGFLPVFEAFRCNQAKSTEELVKYGADLNDSGVFDLLPRVLIYHESIQVKNVVLQHCVKLSVLGLTCNVDYKSMMDASDYNQEHELCLNEITGLKNTWIDDRTSLYSYLHMDPNSRGAYINNEKLRNIIEQEPFRQYSSLIHASYCEAFERRTLLEPAKRVWLELTNIHLPNLCIECIFAYLSNTDLTDLIAGDDRRKKFKVTDTFGKKQVNDMYGHKQVRKFRKINRSIKKKYSSSTRFKHQNI